MKNINLEDDKKEIRYLKHLNRIKERHYEIMINDNPVKILNFFIKESRIELISKYKFEYLFNKILFLKIEDKIIKVKLLAISSKVSNYRAIFEILK